MGGASSVQQYSQMVLQSQSAEGAEGMAVDKRTQVHLRATLADSTHTHTGAYLNKEQRYKIYVHIQCK